ncbi:hypothetical protein BC941DRAFT_428039 [Chlamydoabsidia padenii]|nr:hypothetical protein BC941DRAFT_428039 [Chlamydoabsidia padenii]
MIPSNKKQQKSRLWIATKTMDINNSMNKWMILDTHTSVGILITRQFMQHATPTITITNNQRVPVESLQHIVSDHLLVTHVHMDHYHLAVHHHSHTAILFVGVIRHRFQYLPPHPLVAPIYQPHAVLTDTGIIATTLLDTIDIIQQI